MNMKRTVERFISPTYFGYEYLNDSKCSDSMKDSCMKSKHNKLNADNNKYFYYGLALFFIICLSIKYLASIFNNFKNVFVFVLTIFPIIVIYLIMLYCFNRITPLNRLNIDKIINGYSNDEKIQLQIHCYIMNKAMYIFSCLIIIAIGLIIWCKGHVNINIEVGIKAILFYIYGISRVYHFFAVFYKDIRVRMSKDNPDREGPNNRKIKYRRLWLVSHSYISLILDYGILYFVLHKGVPGFLNIIYGTQSHLGLGRKVVNIFDTIYFSGMTITTIGYGDISPNDYITKFYVLTQVLSGMFLLGVNLVIYMSEKE